MKEIRRPVRTFSNKQLKYKVIFYGIHDKILWEKDFTEYLYGYKNVQDLENDLTSKLSNVLSYGPIDVMSFELFREDGSKVEI